MSHTSIQDSIENLTDQVAPQIDKARRKLNRFGRRMTDVIQDHPAACLLGALALGYLVARVARRQS
jgi:hypothetical protein